MIPSGPARITRITAKNFKSLGDLTIDLEPLTFLLGANGSGKSNILDTLQFVADALEQTLPNALGARGGIDEVRRRSDGRPRHPMLEYFIEWPGIAEGRYGFELAAAPGKAYYVKREWGSWHSSAELWPSEEAFFEVGDHGSNWWRRDEPPAVAKDRLYLVALSGVPELRPLYDVLTASCVCNINPESMRQLQAPDPSPHLRKLGQNSASMLQRMKSAPESMQDVFEFLSRVVDSVVEVHPRTIEHLQTLKFIAGGQEFSARAMSDGTLRALGTLLAIFQEPGDGSPGVQVVGIEEPETALHPGAARVMLDALHRASARRQIVVSSHSPDLLDSEDVTPEMLRYVTFEGGQTRVAQIDEASRDIIRDRLFTAGELLRLGQISGQHAEAPGA